MTNILVRCPSCSGNGYIDVAEENLKDVKRGLLAVNIPSDIICTHSFIVYIDKNLVIRDYFIADYQFQIEIPVLDTLGEQKDVIIPEKDLVNLNLIKLNVSANLMTFIFKSIFLKKKILIISEETFLNNIILNFFKYITQDNFAADISMISNEKFNQEKKQYKDYMVFEGSQIINNVKKLINPKKLAIEKQMVLRFLSEMDLNSSLLVLRNDINKIYFLSKSIVDAINSLDKNVKINILKIYKSLEETHKIKINNLYLEFLVDIVRNYFEIKVPSIFESFHDLL
ncbi:MAG: hypothetical protein ACFFHV_11805 [Promethearchaeota archaeon]